MIAPSREAFVNLLARAALVAALFISTGSCSRLMDLRDDCTDEFCDGDEIFRCGSQKESGKRMHRHACEDGTACRQTPDGAQCVPRTE
jgi:hypothetical protein